MAGSLMGSLMCSCHRSLLFIFQPQVMAFARDLLQGGGMAQDGMEALGRDPDAKAGLVYAHNGSDGLDITTPDSASIEGVAAQVGVATLDASTTAGPGREPSSSGPPGGSLPLLEEKRVRNHRIKDELRVRLTFPIFREGLRSIHRGEIRPFQEGDLGIVLKGGRQQAEE